MHCSLNAKGSSCGVNRCVCKQPTCLPHDLNSLKLSNIGKIGVSRVRVPVLYI